MLDADLSPVGARSLPAVAADASRQLSAPLRQLVTAVLDADGDPAARRHAHAAALHVACALKRLARIESPARRDHFEAVGLRVATSGGPVQPYPAWMRGAAGAGYRHAWDMATRPTLPEPSGPSRFDVAQLGRGVPYDALPSTEGWPPPSPGSPPTPLPKAGGRPKPTPTPWPRPPHPQPQGG